MKERLTAEKHRENIRRDLKEREQLIQGRSLSQSCADLKESIEYANKWVEVIAFPQENLARSKTGPQWIAQELMRTHMTLIGVIDHMAKLISESKDDRKA